MAKKISVKESLPARTMPVVPKKVFKVIDKRFGGYIDGNPRASAEVIENALNNGFLVATDLVDAFVGTDLLILVKNNE